MPEVTDPEFYHVERGTFIKINKVMAADEKITVSTVYGRKGVTLQLPDGTEANGFKYLDVGSDLNMQMAPGTNTIRCDAANNREGDVYKRQPLYRLFFCPANRVWGHGQLLLHPH